MLATSLLNSPFELQLYFDYGQSVERRLRRITRADPAKTGPITLAGWYDPLEVVERDEKPSGQTITIYGNSQSVRLADALQASSSRFNARSVAAPGSRLNWGYGAFIRDAGNKETEAVVLTVMPSNLPWLGAVSAMTWNQSFAMPFTSDTFTIENGQLQRTKPPYESFAEYTDVFDTPESSLA